MFFESYEQIHKDIFVRIVGLPIINEIRAIRKVQLNVLIRICGVVCRQSPVHPQLSQVKYDCPRCSYILGPFIQQSDTEIKLSSCPSCQCKGRFNVNVEQVTSWTLL